MNKEKNSWEIFGVPSGGESEGKGEAQTVGYIKKIKDGEYRLYSKDNHEISILSRTDLLMKIIYENTKTIIRYILLH
jgi:hypothetical protein